LSNRFTIARLHSLHERAKFESGIAPLDRYFRDHVTQDIRRRITNCFVAVDAQTGDVAAYNTLAATSVLLTDLPPEIGKKLPRYPLVPAVRLGRLAVDMRYRGQGFGSALLWDATERAIRSEITAFALVVDAKGPEAVAFYRHHGLLPFDSSPMTLFLPLAEAEKRLAK
jgi:ribosomal protein S18 acetylase RimI-like enzyme